MEFIHDALIEHIYSIFTTVYHKADIKDAINIEYTFIGELLNSWHDTATYLLTEINKAIEALFERDDIGNHGKIYNFKTCVLNEQEYLS